MYPHVCLNLEQGGAHGAQRLSMWGQNGALLVLVSWCILSTLLLVSKSSNRRNCRAGTSTATHTHTDKRRPIIQVRTLHAETHTHAHAHIYNRMLQARARRLFKAGLRKPEDVASSDEETIYEALIAAGHGKLTEEQVGSWLSRLGTWHVLLPQSCFR